MQEEIVLFLLLGYTGALLLTVGFFKLLVSFMGKPCQHDWRIKGICQSSGKIWYRCRRCKENELR